MPITVIAVLSVHVLVAIFWAGSTFSLARLAGLGGEKFVFPQLGAATLAILSGGYLFGTMHAGRFSLAEQVLVAGVACAVVALIIQGVIGIPTLRRFQSGRLDVEHVRARIGNAQRAAAGLLAITVITMVLTRYV
jgi:hypothetical protein